MANTVGPDNVSNSKNSEITGAMANTVGPNIFSNSKKSEIYIYIYKYIPGIDFCLYGRSYSMLSPVIPQTYKHPGQNIKVLFGEK